LSSLLVVVVRVWFVFVFMLMRCEARRDDVWTAEVQRQTAQQEILKILKLDRLTASRIHINTACMESSDEEELTRTPARVRGEEPFREGPDEREIAAERAEEEAPHVLSPTPTSTSTYTYTSLPLLLGVPVVAVLVAAGIRVLWRSTRCGSLTRRSRVRLARMLLVDVDDEALVGGAPSGSGERACTRVVLDGELSSDLVPWANTTNGYAVVGASAGRDARGHEWRVGAVREVGRLLKSKSKRGSAPRVLAGTHAGVLAVELGLADVACCAEALETSVVTPWSSIVARGMFGYRYSRGDVSFGVVLAARDPAVLVRCGESVEGERVGAGRNRGGHREVESPKRYLVAEDVFGECGAAMAGVTPSVIEGVKRWAGSEQAQSLSLCQWLFYRVSGVRRFLRKEDSGDLSLGAKPTPGEVLDALVRIRETLRAGLVDVDAGADAGIDAGVDAGIDAGVDAGVDAEDVAKRAEDFVHAQMVAEELGLACQSAMEEGLVFVVPVCPGAPPGKDGTAEDVRAWDEAVMRLNCLSALAGIPQVSIPVAVGGRGGSGRGRCASYVGIGLLTRQRKDLVLLKSLEKLHGFIEADVEARATGKTGKTGKTAGKGDDESDAAAEKEKELGNACFKNKQYAQAVEHYTRAMAYVETNAIYPSNRAMAYLKMGSYEEAEEDCSRALGLDSCNAKALLRRGAARAAIGSYEAAAADYSRVLDIEPGNRQAKEELTRLKMIT